MLTNGKAHKTVPHERLIPEPDAAASDDEDANGRCPGQPARVPSLLSISGRSDQFPPRAHARIFGDRRLAE